MFTSLLLLFSIFLVLVAVIVLSMFNEASSLWENAPTAILRKKTGTCTSLKEPTLPSFFDVKKQRPKTNLEMCYQYSVSIEVSLDLKVCFSLVT